MAQPNISALPGVHQCPAYGHYRAMMRIDGATSVVVQNAKQYLTPSGWSGVNGAAVTLTSSITPVGSLNYYELYVDFSAYAYGSFSVDVVASSSGGSTTQTINIQVAKRESPHELAPVAAINGAYNDNVAAQLTADTVNVGRVLVDQPLGASWTPSAQYTEQGNRTLFDFRTSSGDASYNVNVTAFSAACFTTRGLFNLDDVGGASHSGFQDLSNVYALGTSGGSDSSSNWFIEGGKFQPFKSSHALTWSLPDYAGLNNNSPRFPSTVPSEFTVEGFITPNVANASGIVITPCSLVASKPAWTIQMVNGHLVADGYDSAAHHIFHLTSNALAVGQETHFALVFKQGWVYFFVNGYLVQSDPYLANLTLALPLDGSTYDGSTAASKFADVSNSAHAVQIQGNVDNTTTNLFYGAGSTYFNGQSDSHNVYPALLYTSLQPINNQDFSIECVMRPTAVPGYYQTILDSRVPDATSATGYRGVVIWACNNGTLRANLDATAADDLVYTPTNITDQHHIALVRQGTTVSLYVDGNLAGSNTHGTSNLQSTQLYIGKSFDNTGPFLGYIAQVRRYVGQAIYSGSLAKILMCPITHAQDNTISFSQWSGWSAVASDATGLIGSDAAFTTPLNAGLRYIRMSEAALYNDVFVPPYAPIRHHRLSFDPYYPSTVLDLDFNPNTTRNGRANYGGTSNVSDRSVSAHTLTTGGGLVVQPYAGPSNYNNDQLTPSDYIATFNAGKVGANITTNVSIDFQYATAWTFEFGIVFNTTQNQQIFNLYSPSDTGTQVRAYLQNGILYFVSWDGVINSTLSFSQPFTFQPGVPYDIAISCGNDPGQTGAALLHMFVNGRIIATVNNPQTPRSSFTGQIIVGVNTALIPGVTGYQPDFQLYKFRITRATRYWDNYIPGKKANYSPGAQLAEPLVQQPSLSQALWAGFGARSVRNRRTPASMRSAAHVNRTTTLSYNFGDLFPSNRDFFLEFEFRLFQNLSNQFLFSLYNNQTTSTQFDVHVASNGPDEGLVVNFYGNGGVFHINAPCSVDKVHRLAIGRMGTTASNVGTLLIFLDGKLQYKVANTAGITQATSNYKLNYQGAQNDTLGEFDVIASRSWGYCLHTSDYLLQQDASFLTNDGYGGAVTMVVDGDPWYANSVLAPEFNDTNFYDQSTNYNHPTVSNIVGTYSLNTITNPFGTNQQMEYFNSSCYVRYPNGGTNVYDHAQYSDYTLKGWFYWDGNNLTNNPLIVAMCLASNPQLLAVNVKNVSSQGYLSVVGLGLNDATVLLNQNTWYHLAICIKNGMIRYLLNGKLVQVATYTGGQITKPYYCFGGSDVSDGGNVNSGFSGYLYGWDIKEKIALYMNNYPMPTKAIAHRPGAIFSSQLTQIVSGAGTIPTFGALTNNRAVVGQTFTTNVVIQNANSLAAVLSTNNSSIAATIAQAVDGNSNPIANTYTVTASIWSSQVGLELVIINYTDTTWTTVTASQRYDLLVLNSVSDDLSLLTQFLYSLNDMRFWLNCNNANNTFTYTGVTSFNGANAFTRCTEMVSSQAWFLDPSAVDQKTYVGTDSLNGKTAIVLANYADAGGTQNALYMYARTHDYTLTAPSGGGSVTWHSQTATRPIAGSDGSYTLAFTASYEAAQTAFFPLAAPQTGANFTLCSNPTISSTAPLTFAITGDRVNPAVMTVVNSAGEVITIGNVTTPGNWFQVSIRVWAQRVQVRINRQVVYDQIGFHNWLGFNLGSFGAVGTKGLGCVGEIVAYSGALSDLQMQQVDNCLYQNWLYSPHVTVGAISPVNATPGKLYNAQFSVTTNDRIYMTPTVPIGVNGFNSNGWHLRSVGTPDTLVYAITGIMPEQTSPMTLPMDLQTAAYKARYSSAYALIPTGSNTPNTANVWDYSMTQAPQLSNSNTPVIIYNDSPIPATGSLLCSALMTQAPLVYPSTSAWNLTQSDFTIDFWCRYENSTQNTPLVNLLAIQDGYSPGVFMQLCLYTRNSGFNSIELNYQTQAQGVPGQYNATVLISGEQMAVGLQSWRYVRLVCSNQTLTLAVNGVVMGTCPMPAQMLNYDPHNLVIGSSNTPDATNNWLFAPLQNDLHIKDVRIQPVALSATDLTDSATSLLTNTSQGYDPYYNQTLLYISGNQSTVGSNTIKDVSTYNRSPAASTTATVAVNSPYSNPGSTGQSLYFDGNSSWMYYQWSSVWLLGLQDFCIEFQVFVPTTPTPSSANNPGTIMQFGANSNNCCNLQLISPSAGNWNLQVSVYNNAVLHGTTSKALLVNAWNSVRLNFVKSTGLMYLMINEVPQGSFAVSLASLDVLGTSAVGSLVIGAAGFNTTGIRTPIPAGDPTYFNGYLRRIRISTCKRWLVPHYDNQDEFGQLGPIENLGDIHYPRMRMCLTGTGLVGQSTVSDLVNVEYQTANTTLTIQNDHPPFYNFTAYAFNGTNSEFVENHADLLDVTDGNFTVDGFYYVQGGNWGDHTTVYCESLFELQTATGDSFGVYLEEVPDASNNATAGNIAAYSSIGGTLTRYFSIGATVPANTSSLIQDLVSDSASLLVHKTHHIAFVKYRNYMLLFYDGALLHGMLMPTALQTLFSNNAFTQMVIGNGRINYDQTGKRLGGQTFFHGEMSWLRLTASARFLSTYVPPAGPYNLRSYFPLATSTALTNFTVTPLYGNVTIGPLTQMSDPYDTQYVGYVEIDYASAVSLKVGSNRAGWTIAPLNDGTNRWQVSGPMPTSISNFEIQITAQPLGALNSNDPFYTSVMCYLPLQNDMTENSDGTMTVNDLSPNQLVIPHFIDRADTYNQLFSQATLACDGVAGHCISLPQSSTMYNWDTNDFTIEAFVRIPSQTFNAGALFTVYRHYVQNGGSYSQAGTISFNAVDQANGNVPTLRIFNYNTSTPALKGVTSIVDGNWHHIAICRNYANFMLFIDGKRVATLSWAGSVTPPSASTFQGFIAGDPSNSILAYNGSMALVRVTNMCRYINDFTTPTAPYPANGNVLSPGAATYDFHAAQPFVPSGTAVQFYNDCDPIATSQSWDFGDGNTSTQANPSHTYAADGPYTVSLTATVDGVANTVTKFHYVSVGQYSLFSDGTFKSDGSQNSSGIKR